MQNLDMDKFAKNLAKGMVKIKPKFDKVFLNNVQAAMSNRVFQDGKATDGSSIGQYAAETKIQRYNEGYQIDYVDLEQTGELRKSMIVAEDSDGELALGFEEITYLDGLTTPKNARDQERRFGKQIFSASKSEIDKAINGALQAITPEIDKIITQSFK